ncbi:hypothetical protein ACFVXQ_32240, partial [Kitasatospora sp. NPDC058263]
FGMRDPSWLSWFGNAGRLDPAATGPDAADGASTEDYLAAIARARPTVTPAMIEEFGADITSHARV